MGDGFVVMDIVPVFLCANCHSYRWDVALVNTADRYDLLTDEKLNLYSAVNKCLACNTDTMWTPCPDDPHPSTDDCRTE